MRPQARQSLSLVFTSLSTGRMHDFIQASALSSSLSLAASLVVVPGSWDKCRGFSTSVALRQCGHPAPFQHTVPSTLQAPCLSRAAPRKGFPCLDPQLLPGLVPHNSSASTKIKGRGAFFLAPFFFGYLFKRKMIYIDGKTASKQIHQMPSITGLTVLKDLTTQLYSLSCPVAHSVPQSLLKTDIDPRCCKDRAF